MVNALSVDLEFWYTAELVKKFVPQKIDDQVVESIEPLLSLMDKYNTKATFFVLGSLAEKYPELIKHIHDKGHEIASHGYSHKTLYDLDKESFDDEIKRSVTILKKITGENPIGFRAPTFSINNSTKWAFEILEKYGFKYDSSIFPIKTMLYGEPTAPLHVYKPSKHNVTINDPCGNIIEFPMTVARLGMNIPICGGFYFRLFPSYFFYLILKKIKNIRPVVIYIHPWETYIQTPRLNLPFFSSFITYYNIKSNLSKFEYLLKNFEFTTMRNVLEL
ncbi:polysaccharide deacetylase family protein [Methanosarcina vacuolata]|uniref:Polysaccharide deacetylase, putative n=1 Tax=Methanosarcina vacuolata Z-761 TaxID=1434123 RepID=A0A0E3Q3Q7_9EURY|nr:polysaccharide deacetylase family protein [Methanosarcina vacuolata]AKB43078.1 polysaccharide deacetylase, putative [Methanosarcina vacuolata Z-761]